MKSEMMGKGAVCAGRQGVPVRVRLIRDETGRAGAIENADSESANSENGAACPWRQGIRRGSERERHEGATKSVGKSGLRGVAGAYAGYAVKDEGSVAGRREENRWISALCEMRFADAAELHRKERYALHLTWRHLPTAWGFLDSGALRAATGRPKCS